MLCTVIRKTNFKPCLEEWQVEFITFSELRRYGLQQSKKYDGCNIIIIDENGKVWQYNQLAKQ